MNAGFRCALTGHRDLPEDFDLGALHAALEGLLREGYTTFCCGMARGFDLTALSYLVERKAAYHVRIEAFVPYLRQDFNYSYEEKILYRKLMEKCDEVHILTQGFYKGAALVRDRLMVDSADIVLAYLRKDSGGTAFTVRYAQKTGVEVRFI